MDNTNSEGDQGRSDKSYPIHTDGAMLPSFARTKAVRYNNDYGSGEHKQNVNERTVCNGKVQR